MAASGLVVMVVVAALAGYFIGSADKAARRNAEPPDPIQYLPPSPSKLHLFERGAVCTDAPQCSEIGR